MPYWPYLIPLKTIKKLKLFAHFLSPPSQLKTCAHPTIKLSSTNSETKSCQTFSTDHDKKSKIVSDDRDEPVYVANVAHAHVQQNTCMSAPPDITQVNTSVETQSSLGK